MISFASATGLTAGIIHLFNHALTKGALFLVIACVVLRVGGSRVSDFAGLGQRMPWTMGVFVLASLSLIGVPLTAGFTSKWYLLEAALQQGLWPVAAMVVLASLMTVVYTGKVIEAAYFREPSSDSIQARAKEVPLEMLIPMFVFAICIVYFGVNAELSAGVAGEAARMLLGVVQ